MDIEQIKTTITDATSLALMISGAILGIPASIWLHNSRVLVWLGLFISALVTKMIAYVSVDAAIFLYKFLIGFCITFFLIWLGELLLKKLWLGR